MDADALQRAWVAQAQADAERGVVACRMCRWQAPLDEALTLWRNGVLVFAVCDRCTGASDVLVLLCRFVVASSFDPRLKPGSRW
jgi:hypothetical protein